MAAVVGIDVGATLCKLVRLDGDGFERARFPSTDLPSVRACVQAWQPARVGVIGGGAGRLAEHMPALPVHQAGEFDAWARGAAALAARDGVPLPPRCLVVSVGTGTSVLALDGERVERAGGTAIGGGTMLGLGRLLLGVDGFDALVALAASGDRRRVDLLIGDVYPTAAEAPLLRDLSASNFAKLDSTAPADIAHALLGMVAETVALVAGSHAQRLNVDEVVYGGSTLDGNPVLRAMVGEITQRFGHRPRFLAAGAYGGALGAALVAADGVA